LLDETPLKNVKAPRVPVDQLQPLSSEQVQALVDAARRLQLPERIDHTSVVSLSAL
jgi:hypothetical protein